MEVQLIVITVYSWVILMIIIAYLARRRILFKAPPTEFLERFFLGGRTLSWLVLGLSASISAYSMGTFLGGVGLGYALGFMWAYAYPLQGFLVFLLFLMIGRKIAIVGRRVNAVTLIDVIRARYGKLLEMLTAIFTVVFILSYILPQFFGGARAFEGVTGFPYTYALVLFIILTTIYTTLGGFLGESWTDTISAIVGATLFLIYVPAVLMATGKFGGLVGVCESLRATSETLVKGSQALYNLALSMVILIGVAAAISLPHSAVRVLAYKDLRALKYGIVAALVWGVIINVSMALIGPISRVFFPELAVPDLANPTMVKEVLVNPLLVGVMIGIVVAGGLTTIDSMLLIVSSSIVKNVIMSVKPDIRPETTRKITYIVMGASAALIIYLALYPPPMLEWTILYAIGGLIATYFAPLVWGLYWKRANKYGALASIIGGIVTYVVSDLYFKPYLQGFHIVVPSFIVSNLLMVIVSLLTPKPEAEVLRVFWAGRRS